MIESQPGSRFVLIPQGSEALQHSRGYITGAFRGEDNFPELEYHIVETGVISVPAGDEQIAHYHEVTTEIVYLIEGSMEMEINDNLGKRRVSTKKGDSFIVEPGVIAQNYNVREGTVVFVVKFPSVPGGDKVKCNMDGNPIKNS